MRSFSVDQLVVEGNLLSNAELIKVNKRLKTLVQAIEGTLPGSRGFGLDPDIIDKEQPDEALNLFVMDLDEKTQKYIPEISIAGADGKYSLDGSMRVKVYVERRDEK